MKTALIIFCVMVAGCSMLGKLAMDSISPSKGGINTELVVGDKEQVLGSNQDIKATSVGKVVGNSDNSTAVASAKDVQINNNTIPLWIVILLVTLAALVGWLAPRPEWVKRAIQRKTK